MDVEKYDDVELSSSPVRILVSSKLIPILLLRYTIAFLSFEQSMIHRIPCHRR